MPSNMKNRIITNIKKNKIRITTGNIIASLSRVSSKQSLQNLCGVTIAGGINIVRSYDSPIISLLHL